MIRHLGTAARVLFAVAGVVFLVVAFLATWDRAEGLPVPPAGAVAAAFALAATGLVLGLRAWAVLLAVPPGRMLARGFFLAQLGKYVPGAVWQAVGQVGYATRSAVPVGQASTAFAISALTQGAAGAVVGVLVVVAPDVPTGIRLLAVAGLTLLVLLDRRWMRWAVQRWRRSRTAPDDAVPLIPEQRRIVVACAYNALTLLVAGVAFTVLVWGLAPAGLVLAAVPAFALAWTVGFLALPFPSGLGVREAVLIAALSGVVGTPAIIAASVALRLVTMAAEGALVLATRFLPPTVAGPLPPPAR